MALLEFFGGAFAFLCVTDCIKKLSPLIEIPMFCKLHPELIPASQYYTTSLEIQHRHTHDLQQIQFSSSHFIIIVQQTLYMAQTHYHREFSQHMTGIQLLREIYLTVQPDDHHHYNNRQSVDPAPCQFKQVHLYIFVHVVF